MGRPKREFVYVTSSLGHYDLLHPDKEQASFVFHNLSNGLKCSYSVNEKHLRLHEGLSPLEVAEELQNIICTEYLYNSNKEKIAKVVAFLEANQGTSQRDSLTYEIELADYEIAEWKKKKVEAENRLATIEAEGKPS